MIEWAKLSIDLALLWKERARKFEEYNPQAIIKNEKCYKKCIKYFEKCGEILQSALYLVDCVDLVFDHSNHFYLLSQTETGISNKLSVAGSYFIMNSLTSLPLKLSIEHLFQFSSVLRL